MPFGEAASLVPGPDHLEQVDAHECATGAMDTGRPVAFETVDGEAHPATTGGLPLETVQGLWCRGTRRASFVGSTYTVTFIPSSAQARLTLSRFSSISLPR